MELKSDGWHILLLGELYGGRGHGGEREQALLEIVRGERPASQLNGHLLLWAWEERFKRWHVWTDRFGTLHAYHARSGAVAALGTCSQAVAQLASRRNLDWPALAGFFGFGFFPEDRTFYDDVRILRPATHYIFSARGEQISAKRYWEWQHSPDLDRSYDDTVAEFASIFETVMAGLLESGLPTTDHGPQDQLTSAASRTVSLIGDPGNRIAIPISGGLDSRSTVATLSSDFRPRLSDRLWSYSYGYVDDSVETRIARQVAAARGLPFTSFNIKPYLFDHLDQILGAVEGFQDLTQCRQAFVAEALGQNADHVIAAHWGDVWLDEIGLAGNQETTGPRDHGRKSVVSSPWSSSLMLEYTLKKMSKQGRTWLLENLCAPHFDHEKPEGLLPQFVNAGLDRLEQIEDADFRIKAFKTDHWSFRWTLSSLRMFQAAAFPRLPFYDTRLADFFGTVPSAFLNGRKLQIDYLKRFAPDLARIEWQAKGADLYHCPKPDPWQLPRRAVNKALRLVTGKKTIERNWEVQFSGEQGQAELEHWLLRSGLRLHEFVPIGKIATLLQEFQAGPLKKGRGYTVSMLLTFSVWLQQSGDLSLCACSLPPSAGRPRLFCCD